MYARPQTGPTYSTTGCAWSRQNFGSGAPGIGTKQAEVNGVSTAILGQELASCKKFWFCVPLVQHHWHDQSLGLHQETIISLKGNVKVSKGVKTESGPVLTQLDLLMCGGRITHGTIAQQK